MSTIIDICICTFRRPHIADTMRSLAKLDIDPDWNVRVIVADNEDQPNAKSLVEETAKTLPFPVTYVHAPARNISIARNACLQAADGEFLAFIDDDELVSKTWLSSLMKTQTDTGAEVVLGPVTAVYGANCPAWIKQGDFHASKPVKVNGEIITGYSCNVLIKREAPSIKDLRFRLDLGKTGGEDTVFFTAVYNQGGKFAFAPDAMVSEEVPANRARFDWLLKRKFRFGQTHGLLLLESKGECIAVRLQCVVKASVKSLYCFLRAPLHIFQKSRFFFWVLRGTMHAGVVSRLLGKREIIQYGSKEPA